MKIIRNKCFETNSSSTHSISLGADKDVVLDTIYPDSDGNIDVFGGEYGWEWFKHNDPKTKLSYLYTLYQGSEEKLEEIVEIVKSHTGANSVTFQKHNDTYYPVGYIDHQSIGRISFNNKEEIKNFIFNKNAWLFGGNDNGSPPNNFYTTPTYYKDGKCESLEYKYILTCDLKGIGKENKFYKEPNAEEVENCIRNMVPSYRSKIKNGKLEIIDEYIFRDPDFYNLVEIYFDFAYPNYLKKNNVERVGYFTMSNDNKDYLIYKFEVKKL